MTFERVRDLIAEQFDLEPDVITMDSTLDDLSADSLDLYDLVQNLEAEFDIEFREEDFDSIQSVADIVKHLDEV
ncbi:MAG: acyl carrier protein [Oscillospiraceae bacterium]|jgi:acyl carrier protein|nr:acyl carrier protein [Oscillospiraceae bacterium]